MSFTNLTPAQLHKAAGLKEKIEVLQAQLETVLGGNSLPAPVETPESESFEPAPKKRKFTAAGLARLRAAQQARWAKVKAGKPAETETAAAKIEPLGQTILDGTRASVGPAGRMS